MRTIIVVAIVAALALSLTATVRAEDEPGYLGIMVKKAPEGIEISGVGADSPADKGGLKKGDIIKKLNGEEVATIELAEFVKKIQETKPGAEVKILLLRDGQEQELKVKVGKMGGD